MKGAGTVVGTAFVLLLAGAVVWLLKLDDAVRASISAGHLLDWVTGGICLVWLLLILKVPWDLYFQAQEVSFEFQRSRERGIPTPAGREEYIRGLRRRLGWLAVGAHLVSAALTVGVARFTGGQVGCWFAVFYLVSTIFRPAAAGYAYLAHKLRDILREVKYPREDVVDLRERVKRQEVDMNTVARQMEEMRESIATESAQRASETRELRQSVHAIGREFEATVSRLTDNQEVIRGIQAFVRLVAQSAGPS